MTKISNRRLRQNKTVSKKSKAVQKGMAVKCNDQEIQVIQHMHAVDRHICHPQFCLFHQQEGGERKYLIWQMLLMKHEVKLRGIRRLARDVHTPSAKQRVKKRESFLPMLNVRGGKTDHTAFFCIEVTFFFLTVLKHSANFELDLLRVQGSTAHAQNQSSPLAFPEQIESPQSIAKKLLIKRGKCVLQHWEILSQTLIISSFQAMRNKDGTLLIGFERIVVFELYPSQSLKAFEHISYLRGLV